MAEPAGMRIGDAERRDVVERLRRATGEGRLTLDEFSARVGDAYAARTREELDRVVADLPREDMPPAPVLGGEPEAGGRGDGSGRRGRTRRRFVAIMGGSHPRGRWHAGERLTALAFWGGVKLDLREALIESSVIDIKAWAIMGGVTVVLPEGIPVELDGFVLMGGSKDSTRSRGRIDGGPRVRVHARGLWGGVEVRTSRRHQLKRVAELVDQWQEWGRQQDPPVAGAESPWGRPMAGYGRRRAPSEAHDAKQWARAGVRDAKQWARDEAGAARRRPRMEAGDARPPGQLQDRGTYTVLVTDICGSTGVAERLGDQRWLGVLQEHNALIREQIQRHHGTEVKAQGDGFLASFASARHAVLAAIDIQRAMADYRRAQPEHQIQVRIGIHTGEMAFDHGDLVGQNVVIAVRIADVAAPGEVLVSRLTKDLTEAGGDLCFDGGRETTLRGISRPWQVHAVAWDGD